MERVREKLKVHIKNGEYEECRRILCESIKQILTNKIKEKDKNFEYVNLPNLRSRGIKLLDNKNIVLIEKFCQLYFEDINEEYEVIKLMELFKELQD